MKTSNKCKYCGSEKDLQHLYDVLKERLDTAEQSLEFAQKEIGELLVRLESFWIRLCIGIFVAICVLGWTYHQFLHPDIIREKLEFEMRMNR